MLRSGNLTLSRNGDRPHVQLSVRLYVTGNLTLTGPVTVNCSDLRVGGTLTINNTRCHGFGGLRDGTVSAAPTDHPRRPSTSAERSTITNTTWRPSVRRLYGGADISVTSLDASRAPSSTHRYVAAVYATRRLAIDDARSSGNVQLYSRRDLIANGNLHDQRRHRRRQELARARLREGRTSTSPIDGDVNWSGTASVTSRDYAADDPTADARSPADVDGTVLVAHRDLQRRVRPRSGCPGTPARASSSTSTGASTILCPLLCTTEKTTISGNITFGYAGAADGLLLHVRQQRDLPAGVPVRGPRERHMGPRLRPPTRERTTASW